MIDDPVFIIGTERSGSNLLRLLLDSHGALAIPHPPHVLRYLGPLEASYGDLGRPDNLRRLAADVLALVRAHIHPWPSVPSLAQLIEDAWQCAAACGQPPSLYLLYAALHEHHRRQAGKRRWGCKSTFMLERVDDILRHHRAPRLLWLVRDPRDVAASSKRSVFNPYDPLLTARLWARQQRQALALEARLGPARLLRLRYEDLLAAPEAELGRVCAFVGEGYEPAMLRYFERPEAHQAARLSRSWVNAGRPILRDNAGKHQRDLSSAERADVEAACAALMAALGYQDHGQRQPAAPGLDAAPPGPTTRADFISGDPAACARNPLVAAAGRGALRHQARDLWLRLGGELDSLRHDRNHWRRWGRAALLARLHLRQRLRVALSREQQD